MISYRKQWRFARQRQAHFQKKLYGRSPDDLGGLDNEDNEDNSIHSEALYAEDAAALSTQADDAACDSHHSTSARILSCLCLALPVFEVVNAVQYVWRSVALI